MPRHIWRGGGLRSGLPLNSLLTAMAWLALDSACLSRVAVVIGPAFLSLLLAHIIFGCQCTRVG